MIRRGHASAVLVTWIVLGCGPHGPQVSPQPPAPPTKPLTPPPDAGPTKIGVALTVTPSDAEVLIDGESHGLASSLDPVVELKPGLYTLQVRRDGYASYRVEFSIADKTETFVIQLEPIKH